MIYSLSLCIIFQKEHMRIIRNTSIPSEVSVAATMGFFDGVHLGHRFLIDELKLVAKERDLPAAVITFNIHPRKVLQATYQPQLINTIDEKIKLLESTGIDYCIILDFTIELSKLSAEEFIRHFLSEQLHVKALLTGYDHRFGHNRTEGFDDYVSYGKACGMEVIQSPPFLLGETTISSSTIRRLLARGKVSEAEKLLKYPYQLEGTVVHGRKLGRTIGFPTANIAVSDTDKIIPQPGVYAAQVKLDNQTYNGMLYIGDRPTVDNGNDISVEVNILDFDQEIYDKKLTVSIIEFIRDDQKFNSLEELKGQLHADKIKIKETLNVFSDKES